MAESRGSSSVSALLSEVLGDFAPDPEVPVEPAAQKAAHLARRLQERASSLQTPQERHQQAELDRMIGSVHDRAAAAFNSRSRQAAVSVGLGIPPPLRTSIEPDENC